MSFTRAQLSLVLSSRRLLAPVTLLLFSVIGIYVYRPNPVLGSFAVTAIIAAFFSAWLVAAVERELTPTTISILTVRGGGAVRAWLGRVRLVAIVVLVVTVFCLIWPTATDAFDRSPGLDDLLAAGLGHIACGAVGGALALLLGSPTRVATAFATILAVIIASIALAKVLGVVAGPGGVSQALGNSAPDTVSVPLLAASAVALLQAAALIYAARWQARWRG